MLRDSRLLYVCPRADECDSKKCDHREVHLPTMFCDAAVVIKDSACPGCIPANVVIIDEEEPA